MLTRRLFFIILCLIWVFVPGCVTTNDYDSFYLLAQRVKFLEDKGMQNKLQKDRIDKLERKLDALQYLWEQNAINSNTKEYKRYMELKKKFEVKVYEGNQVIYDSNNQQ